MSNGNSYNAGMIAGIELYGRVCGKQVNCEQCPIESIKATGITCQEFAQQFPAKLLSLLKEMDDGQLTFFQEYCIRFPHCNIAVEDLAQFTCRKAVFEGYLECEKEGGDCIDCWNKPYVQDVTEFDESDEQDNMEANTVQTNQIINDMNTPYVNSGGSNVKYCAKCGTALDSNAKFCLKCGSPQ